MKEPIRFATFLAPSVRPVYQFVADYVSRQLDYPTTLSVGVSFDQFDAKQTDVGFICGLPYIRLADQTPSAVDLLAAPVLVGERYHNRPVYFSDVIVRRDSPFQTFADLRGRSWAYNDPDSHSGFNVTRYWLGNLGESGLYFGQIVRAGAHVRSIELVRSGGVDASAIDSQVLAIEMQARPELRDELRIIEAFGPSPIQPVVASRHVSASLKADLRAALLALADDPAAPAVLQPAFVSRFAAVTDSDYEEIRRMAAVGANVAFG